MDRGRLIIKILKTWIFWIIISIALVVITSILNNWITGSFIDILNGIGISILVGIVFVFVFYGIIIFPIKSLIKYLKK